MTENIKPEIVNKVSNLDDYDKVVLAFPIWWYKEPTIIDKFLEENHIYGLDLLGGGPESNLGVMAFDPYDKNYNKVVITDEERELLIGACKNATETNDEIPYTDCLPLMVTPNEHYLFGVGEGKTLFNGVAHIMDGMVLS